MSTEQHEQQKRRGGAFVKFGIAGLAILGIGGALTTAAWTDQVLFGTGAAAAAFNLVGSNDGTTWSDAATEDSKITIPIELDGLVPGTVPIETDVFVRNDGSVDTAILVSTTTTGDLFADETVIVTATADDTVLGKSDTSTITISVTPGAMTGLQGKSGTIFVTVTGTVA